MSTRNDDRRMRGFERADGLLQRQIRTAGEGRGFAVSRLLIHWAEVAGDDLADITRPVKISYGRGGIGATLTLLTSGAHAPMVQAELARLKDRVNACYGYAAIQKIRLTQTAPTGFSEGKAEFRPAPRRAASAQPTREAIEHAQVVTRGVTDANLKNALESLAAHIMSNPKPVKG